MVKAKYRIWWLPVFAGALLVAAFVLLFILPAQSAYAETREELKNNYEVAVINYQAAVAENEKNDAEIVEVKQEISQTERKIDRAEDQLGDTAISLYKGSRRNDTLIELLLSSSGFQDAVIRFDQYEKIEEYYREKIGELSELKERLGTQKAKLEQRKVELEAKVTTAKQQADAAHAALLANMHTDGAKFHQAQGNGSNCGATAFIVGVNVLLHENRYIDNVAVWNGPGFNGDSTTDLAYRASVWLAANGLSSQIGVEYISEDIHTAQQLRDQLEQGYVVVISSGGGSVFQRADGNSAPAGSYPDGHWILFYCYDNGIYYANDSAVGAAQGAGCPYTEEQLQQWLDGRSYHHATVLKKF